MNQPRARQVVGATGAAALLWLVSCGGAGENSLSSDDSAVALSDRAVSGDGVAVSGAADEEGAKGAGALEVDARSISYAATVDLVVDDVEEAVGGARAVVAESGGVMTGQSTDISDSPRSTVTFDVPPDALDDLLDELSGLGDLQRRSVEATDLTSSLVDLDARLLSSQASLDRMRALVAQANSVSELAALENDLGTREVAVEQLLGQQRLIEDRVTYSTITLTLSEEAPAKPIGEKAEGIPGVGSALASGIGALTFVARLVGAAVGYVAPFAAVLAVAYGAGKALGVSRRRRGRTG